MEKHKQICLIVVFAMAAALFGVACRARGHCEFDRRTQVAALRFGLLQVSHGGPQARVELFAFLPQAGD